MKDENQLMAASAELLTIAEIIQNEAAPEKEREAQLKTLAEKYHHWYRSALILFDSYKRLAERRLFEQEYEGSFWSAKIIKFLSSGLELNPIYIQDNPLTDKWTFPFKRCFQEPFLKQCNYLASLEAAAHEQNTKTDDYWNDTICRIFKVFIEKAEQAKTPNEKKLTYAYLAIFLIGAIDGLSVIRHDARGASEEVDLWVANESKNNFWRSIGSIFIVECKNWGESVGAPQVRSLRTILQDKHINFAILLAKNGITGDNWHDAVDTIRKSVTKDNIFILVLDHADLLEIANGLHPTEKIRQKYYELFIRS